MADELSSRHDVTLESFHRVAWRREPVRIAPEALVRIGAARASFMALLESDPDLTIYGVTTGYGQNAHTKLSPSQRKAQARQPPFAAAASFGEAVPERVARGIVLARLANMLGGHAAVSPELAIRVAAMLDGPPLPPVPWPGQGGAGEILSLSHLFSDVAGSIDLGEKESLALVNGSPAAAALVADAALAARRRLGLALPVFALAVEAIRAPLEHFAADLDALWGDEQEAEALRGLRRSLAGAGGDRRPFQAPVSFRILPTVLGQAFRAVATAEKAATTSLASVSDNPVYLPPDADHPLGRVYSTGGYHNAMATPALDDLAAAWADLALLADRQTTKLLDGRVSLLPDQLQAEGTHAYLGCLPMATVGYVEQARHAATGTLLPGSESGGFGQNDVAPLTFLAWAKEREAGWCLEAALANLAVVASQALFVTGRPAPAALAPILEEVRRIVPPPTDEVRPGPAVAPLATHWRRAIHEGAD
jgi:histidine ammonia-lyase